MQIAWLIPSLVFGVVMAATTGAWQMLAFALSSVAIMPFVLRARRKRDFNTSGAIEITDTHVFIGDHQLPRWQIFWRQEWHDVLFRRLRPELLSRLAIGRLEGDSSWLIPVDGGFVIGANQAGNPIEIQLCNQDSHLLIVGPTGAGKSQLLSQMLRGHLAAAGQNRDLPASSFWLYDFKGGAALSEFEGDRAVAKFITDIDGHDSNEVWDWVKVELIRRERLVAAGSVLDSSLYLVIDELAEALASSSLASAALASLLARGRSLRFHLIAASQSLQGLPRHMLMNFGAHILLGRHDPMLLVQLGIKGIAEQSFNFEGWITGVVATSAGKPQSFIFPART